MADKEIDMCGKFCPEPVFQTKIEIERMQTGETLTVIADDPMADEDINRWLSKSGHEKVDFQKEGDKVTFKIKKVK